MLKKQRMKLNKLIILVFAGFLFVMYSCNVVPSIMMKTKKDFQYNEIPQDTTSNNYIISKNDIIDFKLYTNDGTRLVDMTALTTGDNVRATQNMTTNYLVESTGLCKLPIIGRVMLQGKTIKEAENFLQEQYSSYYKKPFVLLRVENRRVTVFSGIGKGQVIVLNNENMTIIEALAQVGGLPKESKAHKIKLVRGNLKDPQIYLFDFSTVEGIKNAGFVLQANDIIYVEPRKNAVIEVVRDVAPVLSLITSTITLIVVISRLN